MSTGASPSLHESLRDLHDEYVEAVNRAVAEHRDDLVDDLAAEYPDRALALLSEFPAA